jgi:hypothetical protein
VGWDSPFGTSATNWPIVPAPDDRWWWMWNSRWNENWQGKPKYSEKTCPIGILSTTNPTWPDLRLNPGRRGGKPATNRLSYGTTIIGWFTVHSDCGSSWFSPVSTERHSTSSKLLPICNTYLIPSNLISCHISSEILTQLKCKIMILDWKLVNLRNMIHPHNAAPTLCKLFH